jgi:C_GCAxxG_C_C family probable redox protein
MGGMASVTGAKASELYLGGYNCAEAAWLALSQDLDGEKQAFGLRLSSGFGGGAACGSLCGAVAGAIMAIGRWYGRELGGARAEDANKLTKALVEAVRAKYGSIDCADMKPKGENYRETCAEYVAFCVAKAEELMDKGPEDDDCG